MSLWTIKKMFIQRKYFHRKYINIYLILTLDSKIVAMLFFKETNDSIHTNSALKILYHITYLLFWEICSSLLTNAQHSSFNFVKTIFWEVISEYCSLSRNNKKPPTNIRCLWLWQHASICRVVKVLSSYKSISYKPLGQFQCPKSKDQSPGEVLNLGRH